MTATTQKLIRAPHGNDRREEPVELLVIPDLWKAVQDLKASGEFMLAAAVLDTWQIAHDLKHQLQFPTGDGCLQCDQRGETVA